MPFRVAIPDEFMNDPQFQGVVEIGETETVINNQWIVSANQDRNNFLQDILVTGTKRGNQRIPAISGMRFHFLEELPEAVVFLRTAAITAGSQPCSPDDRTLDHGSKPDERSLSRER